MIDRSAGCAVLWLRHALIPTTTTTAPPPSTTSPIARTAKHEQTVDKQQTSTQQHTGNKMQW
jgi:hypothetical protein